MPELALDDHDLQTPSGWAPDEMPHTGHLQQPKQPLPFDILPDTLNWLEEPRDSNDSDPLSLSTITLPQLDQQVFVPGEHSHQAPGQIAHQDQPCVLPRSTSPHETSRELSRISSDLSPGSATTLELSDEYHSLMQDRIAKTSEYMLPSRYALSGYISRYFSNFNRHQPLIHEPTWSPNEAPVPLVLAVCANGSVYSLEHAEAVELYRHALRMLLPTDTGVWVLQTLMLLTAFAAWSGDPDDLRSAMELHGRLTLELRKEWMVRSADPADCSTWSGWLAEETRRRYDRRISLQSFHTTGVLILISILRTTYCIFTLFNLMSIAFDIPSPITLEPQHGMPSHEKQWNAGTEEEWAHLSRNTSQQTWKSVGEVLDRLFDQSQPVPTGIGTFGCHVVISSILQRITFLGKSHPSLLRGFSDMRHGFMQALRRWQTMWESEPEASLSPSHPQGPISFNSTAMLRLAYIRLVSDYSPVRKAFCFPSTDTTTPVPDIYVPPCPPRTPDTERAAMQATLALYIPARLGFKVVSRTSFWIWSVQHALSYFECALLLSQWLQVVEDADDVSPEETRIKRTVEDILQYSKPRLAAGRAGSQPLSVSVLLLWAELLDTGETTVWKIMPQMSRVLEKCAEAILRSRLYSND